MQGEKSAPRACGASAGSYQIIGPQAESAIGRFPDRILWMAWLRSLVTGLSPASKETQFSWLPAHALQRFQIEMNLKSFGSRRWQL